MAGILRLEHVSKSFHRGTANERAALQDIQLHLPPGEFLTVIGGNGAGKSTLLNAVSGIFPVDQGSIRLGGEDITFLKEYRRSRHIGRLFQDPLKGTAPNMTIAENLLLAYLRGTGRGFSLGLSKRDEAFFKEQLAQLGLGLEDRLKSKMGLLSGGQRQAVTLLMATIVTPRLLMLDEHTAALDPATGEKVLQLTQELIKKSRITTIMVTHNISSALSVGTRTIMMDEGRIILDLSGREREEMTVEKLLELFREKRSKQLDNDRMLLN